MGASQGTRYLASGQPAPPAIDMTNGISTARTGIDELGQGREDLAQIILSGVFSRLGGVWAVLAAHFPFQYGQALVVRVASSAFGPGEMASIGRY